MRRLKKGDRVTMDCWGAGIAGVVTEDRGMIGVGGRQLVRVRWDSGPPEHEVPAEVLEFELSKRIEGETE